MKSGPGLEMSQWDRKFAYIPKKVSSGKWVWFSYFYERRIHIDRYGMTPISQMYWSYTYSKKEFMIETLRGRADEPIHKNIQEQTNKRQLQYINDIYKRYQRRKFAGPKFK